MSSATDRFDGERGRGLYVDGARLTATRLHVERTREVGIRVLSDRAPDATAHLTDVTVLDVGADMERDVRIRGIGLHVTDAETEVTVTRGAFSRSRYANIHITDAEVTLDHVFVSEGVPTIEARGKPPEDVEIGGFGLLVEEGATVVARTFHAVNNHDVGVLIRFEDNDVLIEDAVVEGGLPAGDALGYSLFGGGVAVGLGARARMKRFVIDGNVGPGIRVYDGGLLEYRAPNADLEDGIVSNNAVGALVQARDYETQRLAVRVLFRDNPAAIASVAED